MKRGCWIAVWALGAYVVACIGVGWADEAMWKLLSATTMPGWLVKHLRLMTELARGLFPYVTGSVVFCLGFGGHLPGTRRNGPR
ncbi:MAG TPA: hypothetical protein VFC26_08775 [Verrucomicrobiae bacterium]|nr:hypothetical protein [Verrucomicrobiae bacterium]